MALTFHPSREAIALALERMKADGLVHPDATFNENAPDGLRSEVAHRDPYFAYRLGRTAQESKIVDSALELLKSEGHVPVSADYDRLAVDSHRANFKKLENVSEVELIAEDARTALDRIEGPFDFVYIEAKYGNRAIAEAEAAGETSELGPVSDLYLILLKQLYDRLPEGAWVMAHDNLDWTARKEFAPYLAFVRDKAHFRESICFDIDDCGMERSIR